MQLSQCHTLKDLQGLLSKPLFYVSSKGRVKKLKTSPRFAARPFGVKDIFPGCRDLFDSPEEAMAFIPPKPEKRKLTPLEKRVYDFLGTHGDGYGEDEWMETSLGYGFTLKVSQEWFETTNLAVLYKTVGVGWDQSEIQFTPQDYHWNLTEGEKVSRKLQIVERAVGLYNYSRALVKALREIGFGRVAILEDENSMKDKPALCCRLFGKWGLFANYDYVGIYSGGKIFESARSDEIIRGFKKLLARTDRKGLCLDGRPFLSALPKRLVELISVGQGGAETRKGRKNELHGKGFEMAGGKRVRQNRIRPRPCLLFLAVLALQGVGFQGRGIFRGDRLDRRGFVRQGRGRDFERGGVLRGQAFQGGFDGNQEGRHRRGQNAGRKMNEFTGKDIEWLEYAGAMAETPGSWILPLSKGWTLKMVKEEGSVSALFCHPSRGVFLLDSGKDFLDLWKKLEYRCEKDWWPEDRFKKPRSLWKWLDALRFRVEGLRLTREVLVRGSEEYRIWTEEERETLTSAGYGRKEELGWLGDPHVMAVRYFKDGVMISKMRHWRPGEFLYWVGFPGGHASGPSLQGAFKKARAAVRKIAARMPGALSRLEDSLKTPRLRRPKKASPVEREIMEDDRPLGGMFLV